MIVVTCINATFFVSIGEGRVKENFESHVVCEINRGMESCLVCGALTNGLGAQCTVHTAVLEEADNGGGGDNGWSQKVISYPVFQTTEMLNKICFNPQPY
jgi:hypothetical protein